MFCVHDHGQPLHGRRLRLPAPCRFTPAARNAGRARLVGLGLAGRPRSACPAALARPVQCCAVEMDVRIASGMGCHPASDPNALWIEPGTSGAGFKVIPASPGCMLRIARLAQQQRQPARFHFRSRAHHQIGVARAAIRLGPGLDPVRILAAPCGAVDGGLVAGEFLHPARPIPVSQAEHLERRQRRLRQQRPSAPGTVPPSASKPIRLFIAVVLFMCRPPRTCARRARQAHDVLQEHLMSVKPSRDLSLANWSRRR